MTGACVLLLKRKSLHRRLVKFNTDGSLPVKTNPSQIAQVEIKAIEDTFLKAGASKVCLRQLDRLAFQP